MIYIAKLLGIKNISRVKPGELVLKQVDSWYSIYDYWQQVSAYSVYQRGWTHPSIFQLILLTWCWAYGLGQQESYEHEGHAIRYCYDNVFADISLNGGYEPSGIYGYIDVFTFEGWFEAFAFGIMKKLEEEFWFNLFFSIFMTAVFWAMPNTPLCSMGEQQLIIALGKTQLDLCAFLIP